MPTPSATDRIEAYSNAIGLGVGAMKSSSFWNNHIDPNAVGAAGEYSTSANMLSLGITRFDCIRPPDVFSQVVPRLTRT